MEITEDQLPKYNVIAFDAFSKWKEILETKDGISLGDTQEDWEHSWLYFLAGWKGHEKTFYIAKKTEKTKGSKVEQVLNKLMERMKEED